MIENFKKTINGWRVLNDSVVKDIFDNIRNVTLSVVVSYVGIYMYKKPASPVWFESFVGGYIFLFGVSLFMYNAYHGIKKLSCIEMNKLLFILLSIIYFIFSCAAFSVLFRVKTF